MTMTSSNRKMNLWQLGLYSLVLPNAWSFAAKALAIGIYAGGVPPLVYGTLIWGVLLSLQCLSFAEFSSAYPSSIGLTLIATKLGGERFGRQCGFATGCLQFVAGLVTPAALLSSAAPVAASVGMIANPGYVPKTWHIFLIYQAFNIATNAFSLMSNKFLDRVAMAGGLALFSLYFASLGVIISGSQGTTDSSVVWKDLVNVTGWNNGIVVFIGASLPLSGFGPIHWMMNMADQTENPRRALPITFLIQQVGSTAMMFAFFLAIGYGVGGDWSIIIESPIRAPIGAIYSFALSSQGGAAAMMMFVASFSVISIASYMNATIRLMHGFAVTGAVPGSRVLSKYNDKFNSPTNMAALMMIVTTLLGLLIFATRAVLNTLIGAAMTLYFLGYLPVFLAHILTFGKNLGAEGYFRLPRVISVGVAGFNIVSVLLQAFSLSLPPQYPVTMDNMSWAPLMSGLCIVLLLPVWYMYGKRRYNLDIEMSGGQLDIVGLDQKLEGEDRSPPVVEKKE